MEAKSKSFMDVCSLSLNFFAFARCEVQYSVVGG